MAEAAVDAVDRIMLERSLAVHAHAALLSPDAVSDMTLLDTLAKSIREEASRARINKKQVALLRSRLTYIHNMLHQLPNPRPTPQLLSVMRSGDYLIKCMSYPTLWERVLWDKFTCADIFTAIRERIQGVWRLHSTASWEGEDRAARSKDEVENAATMLRLWQPRVKDLQNGSSSGGGSSGKMPYSSSAYNHKGEEGKSFGLDADGQETAAVVEDNNNITCAPSTIPSDVFIPLSPESKHSSLSASMTTLAATPEDIIAYYQRKQLGFWKVAYEDLDLSTAGGDESAAGGVGGGVSGGGESDACYPRFKVRRGYLFRGQPAVVKELTVDEDAHHHNHLDMETVTAFVEDAVMRMRWCHPGVLQYYGGYTERFATPQMEQIAKRAARKQGELYFPIATTPASLPATPAPAGGGGGSGAGGVGANANVCSEARPVMALGLIAEDLTFFDPAAMRSCTSSPGDGGAMGGGGSPPEYRCLHDVLFKDAHRFTLFECVDITLQMADALQYVLLDSDHIPKEVEVAWMSVAPSNIYVASLFSPSALALASHTTSACYPPALVLTASQQQGLNPLTTVTASSSSVMMMGTPKRPDEDERDLSSNTSIVFKPNTTSRGPSSPLLSRDIVVEAPPTPDLGAAGGMVLQRQPSVVVSEFGLPHAHLNRISSAATTPSKKRHADPQQQQQQQQHRWSEQTGVEVTTTTMDSTAFVPVAARGTYVVKYAPPSYVAEGCCSRWRPHPRAVSPACYALAQLLLALLTNTVPYRHCTRRSELEARLGVFSDEEEDEAGAYATVKVGHMQGYAFPSALPENLRALCREALSFEKIQLREEGVDGGVRLGCLSLQLFREKLWAVRESLDAREGTSPLSLVNDPVYDRENHRPSHAPMGDSIEMMPCAIPPCVPGDYGI